ncbi:MAG: hypothetical protein APF81_04785 [Desulfosporosinus sp. BRH_c37]|nr:MAG: hypothetical protein APF81_04785 [Desulfosporosinus sp. BRH_c37]
MKTTKKEASKELDAVQKAPPFLCSNSLRHRWIVEIVGGHINHPDIPYRSQFATGAVKNILGYNCFHHGLGLRQRQVLPRLGDGNNEGFAAGGKKS